MDLDLAIIGGGPAGVATALFLAAAAPALASRIAILEKETYPRDKICAGAIGARAERALEAIGVRVACPSVAIRGLSIAAGGRELTVRAPGGQIGRVVRRAEFDHAFALQARTRGVRIEEDTRVSGVEVRGDHVRLETSRGAIRARAIVGADGVGSFVRRAIGIPRGRLSAKVVEVDTPATSRDAPRDLLHFDLGDRGLLGYAWDFPTLVAGAPLVCRGLYALEPEALGERDAGPHDVAALLEARLARQGALAGAGPRKRFAERGLELHAPTSRARVLLVGEAAGIDPVLGEGIAQAILYGAVAGPYLAERLGGSALGFSDWSRTLSAARVGVDLAIRTRALRLVYGRARPIVERWVTSSRDLTLAGMRYFAGERVPRLHLARAAWDLARAVL